jgi:glycine dehydrogenase subunit 2
MTGKKGPKIRNFHQAKWDEPVIFELHTPGEQGIVVPPVEQEVANRAGDGISAIPEHMRRKEPPALPEVGQMRVLKHFLRLSRTHSRMRARCRGRSR